MQEPPDEPGAVPKGDPELSRYENPTFLSWLYKELDIDRGVGSRSTDPIPLSDIIEETSLVEGGSGLASRTFLPHPFPHLASLRLTSPHYIKSNAQAAMNAKRIIFCNVTADVAAPYSV